MQSRKDSERRLSIDSMELSQRQDPPASTAWALKFGVNAPMGSVKNKKMGREYGSDRLLKSKTMQINCSVFVLDLEVK